LRWRYFKKGRPVRGTIVADHIALFYDVPTAVTIFVYSKPVVECAAELSYKTNCPSITYRFDALDFHGAIGHFSCWPNLAHRFIARLIAVASTLYIASNGQT